MPFHAPEPSRMTEFALHDRGLASAKIFRPLGRGAGSKANSKVRVEDLLKVNDPFLGEIKLTVGAFYPVGVKEEDLLLVLLGLAGLTESAPNLRTRMVTVGAPGHGVAVKKMRVEEDCLPHDIYEVKATPWLILKELSADPSYHPSADAYAELEPRLKRLSWISYSATGVKGNGRWAQGASAMLSFSMEEDGVVVSFNERLARVILGVPDPENPGLRPKRWFAKISLTERFSLKGDVARILHRLFSVWVDDPMTKPRRGRRGPAPEALTVNVDTLVEHVYGSDEAPLRTRQYRAKTVRDALAEVGSLEKWSVEIGPKGRQVTVVRLPQKTGIQQTRMAL